MSRDSVPEITVSVASTLWANPERVVTVLDTTGEPSSLRRRTISRARREVGTMKAVPNGSRAAVFWNAAMNASRPSPGSWRYRVAGDNPVFSPGERMGAGEG